VSNATLTDTAGDDTYADVTGTLSGSDRDNDTVSFELNSSSATPNGAEKTAGFDVEKVTAYGTFYLNTTSGAYKFVAIDSAVEALKAPTSVAFVVNATDGTADSTPQTITITLAGTNDTPVATEATATASEDHGLVIGALTSTDVDIPGTTAEYTLNSPVAGLTLNNDGHYSFDSSDSAYQHLAAGETLDVVAHFTVTDDQGATSTNTLTITITGNNDAPVAIPATNRATENAPPITGIVTSTDPDVLGKTATYTLDSPIAGLTLHNDGHYVFDPADPAYRYLAANETVDVEAHFTVTDDHGATDSGTLTITVTGIDTPTLTVSNVTVSEASPYVVFVVNLDMPSATDVRFTPTLESGTATVSADTGNSLEYFNGQAWTPLSGAATISAGTTSLLLRVAINNDSNYEGSESFTVNTGVIDGVVLNGAGASGSLTIKDDGTSDHVFTADNITSIPSTGLANDDRPSISVSSITVNESQPYAVFSVSLSNVLSSNVTFTPSLAADTATLTTDFGATLEYYTGTIWAAIPSGGVTIAAGNLSVQLRTTLVQDVIFNEGTERFVVSTGPVTGGIHNASGASGIISITDMKQLSDPVITDVTETASDPTPYDLLTADPTQIVKVMGETGSTVTLYKLDSNGTPVLVPGNLFTTSESSGTYTLDFGNHVLAHGDYVVQLTKSDAASVYSNSFTIDSTPGLYDITGRREIASISETEFVTNGAVGGMDQNRLPAYWNGTNWIDSDGEIIRFSFDHPASFAQEALPSGIAVLSTVSSGSTLTLNTQTGAYSYNPDNDAELDEFTLYASDGRQGSKLILTFDAHDTLDRDGIAYSVETKLAALANPGGGNIGDLNNDGIADANQNAVTTLAWITNDNFKAAIAGTLTDTTPVISIAVVQSTSGNTIDDSAQLYGVKVLAPTSNLTGGSKPTNAQWDPITFSIDPLQSMGLLDADPSREGTQVRVLIDISHSMTPAGTFSGYQKYVNAEAVAAGVKDLDGHLITTPGWYDFTQREEGGDGARFIVSNGIITAIELTITDNGFGDNNMTVGRIYDPGVPVIGNTSKPFYIVKGEANDRILFDNLTDAQTAASAHNTSPAIDFYGVAEPGSNTVALKAWHNSITGDWFYAPEGTIPPYDCYDEQPGTIGRALAVGKGAFDVHLYLNSNGVTQIMGEAEANALGLIAQGYSDKGAIFASAAPVVVAFSPNDGSTGAAVQNNIVLNFSEEIQRGTGTIAIHSGSASGAVVESFDAATDTHLIFSGNKMTIDPAGNLSAGTHYFVSLADGSVMDLAGNHYPGSSDYDFWTESVHNSEMAVTASSSSGGGGAGIIVGAGALGLLAWLAL
jgi:VCBS repeat-containing protein